MVQVFVSRRVMTPQGLRLAAVLVEDGRIYAVVELGYATRCCRSQLR
jgi:hypothetical protein